MTGWRASRGPWYHQLDGNCGSCTFSNACLTFAGKTQAAYRASIPAAHHRNERVSSPSARAISNACEKDDLTRRRNSVGHYRQKCIGRLQVNDPSREIKIAIAQRIQRLIRSSLQSVLLSSLQRNDVAPAFDVALPKISLVGRQASSVQ